MLNDIFDDSNMIIFIIYGNALKYEISSNLDFILDL